MNKEKNQLNATPPHENLTPENPKPEKKPIYKRKWFIVLMVFVVMGAIGGLFSEEETETAPDEPTTAEAQNEAAPTEKAEPNTSARVDQLIAKGKKDAAKADSAKIKKAVNFITKTYPDYFTDNKTMEDTIYYGALLENAAGDNAKYNDMGTDAVQVVKYVYRGAEGKDDEATQSNLEQLKSHIDELTPFSPDKYKNIAYTDLARDPDSYLGEKVTNSGKVIQVMEGDGETQLRVAIDGDYDKVVYLGYPSGIVETRILEDDYITYYGTSAGLISYESTLGGQISIPGVYADKVELQ